MHKHIKRIQPIYTTRFCSILLYTIYMFFFSLFFLIFRKQYLVSIYKKIYPFLNFKYMCFLFSLFLYYYYIHTYYISHPNFGIFIFLLKKIKYMLFIYLRIVVTGSSFKDNNQVYNNILKFCNCNKNFYC